ncbi:MAG: cation transporter dimerization domain-containing protein, partial [Planctomycetota bacterium]
NSFAPRVAGFHDLRSRHSGADIFLELHLDLDRNMSFVEAHDLSEEVGMAIEKALPNSTVTVHADPL